MILPSGEPAALNVLPSVGDVIVGAAGGIVSTIIAIAEESCFHVCYIHPIFRSKSFSPTKQRLLYNNQRFQTKNDSEQKVPCIQGT